MKRTLGFIAAIICLGIVSSAEDGYYYSDGRQIALSVNPDKIAIAFAAGEFGSFDQFLLQYAELSATDQPERVGRNVFVFQLQGETDIDSLLNVIRDDSAVAQASSVFMNELGGEEVIGQYIVLKKSELLSDAAFDSMLSHFSAMESGRSQYLSNVSFVRVDKSQYSVLETANRLYEHEDIIWCHPVFLKRDYQLFYEPQDKLFFLRRQEPIPDGDNRNHEGFDLPDRPCEKAPAVARAPLLL